ncbi:hypothetical protein GCM10010912_68000 [Paenibacillus albidus]|uniref:Uncharacterized protein n=1 Tax=Paenibacillus albidus TaxID=2041023 RepID=A0A917FY98_9BACL|nr:hypothetical protein [Paenibacillus albidus]GGG13985.1 hypothetical protein GCM10010912_68000 [Paenibacillus albidus]
MGKKLQRGALLALLGEPLYKTTNIEDAYSYIVQVKDEEFNDWIFTAYEGPSGPAIGYKGEEDEGVEQAAHALLDELARVIPGDFEEILICEDLGNTITYGCKDGVCYYNEEIGDALFEESSELGEEL